MLECVVDDFDVVDARTGCHRGNRGADRYGGRSVRERIGTKFKQESTNDLTQRIQQASYQYGIKQQENIYFVLQWKLTLIEFAVQELELLSGAKLRWRFKRFTNDEKVKAMRKNKKKPGCSSSRLFENRNLV